MQKEFSVNWQRDEFGRTKCAGKSYKTLGYAKRKAREVVKDINVKRCIIYAIHEKRTVWDALAEKYNIESDYNK